MLLHLARGLVGKGHRRNPVGRIAAFVDQITDLLRNDAGLAAARTGEHEQRGADVFHSFQLTGIEFVHREIEKVITGNGLACSLLYTREPRKPRREWIISGRTNIFTRAHIALKYSGF